MLFALKQDLADRIRQRIHQRFAVDHSPILEIPPRRDLGDLSFPGSLQLARELKMNPRAIGQALADELELPPFVREVRVEGAGFLNFYLDRSAVAAALRKDGLGIENPEITDPATPPKVIVEHTNINPNNAAHIGHLRNAILGDVLARVLRRLGYAVEVQNYIDDTGVQVADVVVGFVDKRNLSVAEVGSLREPFDFYCWDLYSEVGAWYEADKSRLEMRRKTLHALEANEGERAEMGRLVARRVLRRHLHTMARLDIGYDLLTFEGHILRMDFFSSAFEALKKSGAVRLEAEGKNIGCWVMPLSQSEEFAGLEDPDKVIVRSDGTITYVGKDIAYQLWKFGLLDRDFAYRYWMEEQVWETAPEGATSPPAFGRGDQVINVIDARQSYLQKIVRAGLEALDHPEEAARSTHFAYEMVSLSTNTARQFGFLAEGEEKTLEMSGRKGIGVKADDLIDRLEAKSLEQIEHRNPELSSEAAHKLSRQVATAALRFFMTRATTTRVIAFDLEEALSFEGESGPYLQYSMVRVHNIERKLIEAGIPSKVDDQTVATLAAEVWSDDLWDLVWTVAQIPDTLVKAGQTLELSMVARHALDLATKLNTAYNKHPILREEDEVLRSVRLTSFDLFRRGMLELTGVLGIPVPTRM